MISGTPTATGTFTFTLRFDADSGLTDYRTLTITVGARRCSRRTCRCPASTSSEPISLGGDSFFTMNVVERGTAGGDQRHADRQSAAGRDVRERDDVAGHAVSRATAR